MSTISTATTTSTPTLYFAFGSNLWLHQMSLRCPSSQYLGLARLSSYRWLINERGYANVVAIGSTRPSTTKTLSSNSDEKAEPANTQQDYDYSNEVWGMVYSLPPSDEAALDKNEGVPHAYTKHHLECDFWPINSPWPVTHPPPPPHSPASNPISTPLPSDPSTRFPPPITPSPPPPKTAKMLIYIDLKRTTPSTPREEYVYRMNRGIDDMVRCGVPGGYVRGVLRGYIPPEDEEESGNGGGRGGGKGSGKGNGGNGGEEKGGGNGVEGFANEQARGFRDESGIF